jgi:hypothetical protein
LEIPNSYLILIGIIVVIILIPQVKSAKFGDLLEVELSSFETPTSEVGLSLSDTFLQALGEELQIQLKIMETELPP